MAFHTPPRCLFLGAAQFDHTIQLIHTAIIMISDKRPATTAKSNGVNRTRKELAAKTQTRRRDPDITPPSTKRQLPQMTRRTLQDNVYAYLREGLMAGEFAPGEHLTVRGIAATIGTSVMPVREAFRRLTTEGALEPLLNGATRVPVFDVAKLEDLTAIRLSVEGLAARYAAERITAEEFVALEQCNLDVQRAVEAADLAAEAKANERFHFCIYRAAKSPELLRIIEHLWLQMGPYLSWLIKQHHLPTRGRGAYAFRHHEDIVIALRRRKVDQAEAALRADLAAAAAILLPQARKLLQG